MGELSDENAAQLVRNGHALCALYVTHATIALQDCPSPEPWRGYSFCLLARAHHALESIFILREREADCAALVRVLFEHVLTFAWLLIAPFTHYPRLLKGEHIERRKMGADLAEFGISGLTLSDDLMTLVMRADGFEPDAPGPPKLVEMAVDADKYWQPRVANGWTSRFRHAYATLYRAHSTSVHPRLAGLGHFFPRDVEQVGKPPRRDFLRLDADAVGVFFDGLLVASAGLGWPRVEQVLLTAFDGLPTDADR